MFHLCDLVVPIFRLVIADAPKHNDVRKDGRRKVPGRYADGLVSPYTGSNLDDAAIIEAARSKNEMREGSHV